MAIEFLNRGDTTEIVLTHERFSTEVARDEHK